jgi:hypothetical protein
MLRFALLLQSGWGGWLPLPASQRQVAAVTQHELGATTMEITTVGLDLAKNVFQVHAIGSMGEVVVRRALRRTQVIAFFSKPRAVILGADQHNEILSKFASAVDV